MAIYHLKVTPISRRKGKSAVGVAAYQSGAMGCPLWDARIQKIFDFTPKNGVEAIFIQTPEYAPKWARDRERLWNAAEAAERRKDACIAREIVIAIPWEVDPAFRLALVQAFAIELVLQEQCAIDVALHTPSPEGDQRNFHAHLLKTTRKLGPEGMGEKLESEKSGNDRKKYLHDLRKRWEELANDALKESGSDQRVSHRSLREQGIHDREPTIHLGPSDTKIEREARKSGLGPVTRKGKELAKLQAQNAYAYAKKRLDEAQELIKNVKLARKQEEERDENRRAALGRIRKLCKQLSENLDNAKRYSDISRRNPERVAEACAQFKLTRRNSQFAQDINQQIGSNAAERLGRVLLDPNSVNLISDGLRLLKRPLTSGKLNR